MLVTSGAEGRQLEEPRVRYLGLEMISEPVKPHLLKLEEFMWHQVEAFEPEIRDLVGYCLKNSGKRIRPILLFYSGWNGDGRVSDDLIKASAVIEFVHLATLVHDDILDRATLRHNDSTVAKRFGPEVAVLLGDALFSQALKLAADFPFVEVCREVSRATRRVCAGEIAQTFERGNAEIGIHDYLQIIDLKTAELFRVSCFLGARLGGYHDAFTKAVAAFGRYLGMAYQIYDDCADFTGNEDRIGKTLGTDIASGKVTLPVIYLLQALDPPARSSFLEEVQAGDPNDVSNLTRDMVECGALEKARELFIEHVTMGEDALAGFHDLAPVGKLLEISDFVRRRIPEPLAGCR